MQLSVLSQRSQPKGSDGQLMPWANGESYKWSPEGGVGAVELEQTQQILATVTQHCSHSARKKTPLAYNKKYNTIGQNAIHRVHLKVFTALDRIHAFPHAVTPSLVKGCIA